MKKIHTINRRDFLKTLGISATSAVTLASCSSEKDKKIDPNSTYTGPIPTDKMTYRSFAATGKDKVSLLGYGCMRWPNLDKPAADGNPLDQEQVNKLVDYAIEHGVNYFDTSPVYCQGWSERVTGTALKRYPREKYYVATKMSNFFVNPNMTPQESFRRSVGMYEKSKADLQVDYIDYYLLHSVGGGTDPIADFNTRFVNNGLIDYLMKEREAGRIRHLGFSFHGAVELFDYLLSKQDEYHWEFVQIQMNYLDWKHAKENNRRNVNAEYLYTELEKRNIPAVIMEPLLGGRLSRVPDHVVRRFKQQSPESSVASWAFRYCGSATNILTVLSGMTYMEHLQDNIRSFAPLVPLTEEEKQFLYDTADIMMQYPTIPCNDCKYCMPCPYGLDIPAILLHYNKCVNEGNVPKNRQDPNYVKARRAFLVGYDRSVEKLRQANHCTGCNQCSPHCPQDIRIPQQLERIDKFIEQLKQNTL